MDFSQLGGQIWLDGEMVPWQEARVHVLTHTFHYGLGVFEGVRAYKTPSGTSIFRLKEHTDRLFQSAHILRMNMPFDKCWYELSSSPVTPGGQSRNCHSRQASKFRGA